MKKRIIYFLIAVIGTVGFNSCGPTQGTNDTNQDRTGTGTETTTGTTGTTTGDMSGTTTGDRTGTTGTTTGTTGDRTGTTGDVTGTTGDPTTTTGTTQDDYRSGTTQDRNNFELTEATVYTYGTDNYRFTPDSRGINITRDQEGQESPYGTMRSIGDEGYFIITTTSTTGEEEVAVGRFDEFGNFTIYRYDRTTDDITEENYRSGNTQNNNNQNRGGTIDPMNNNN